MNAPRTLVAASLSLLLAVGLTGCRVAYDEPVSPAPQTTTSPQTTDAPVEEAPPVVEPDLILTESTARTIDQLAGFGTYVTVRFESPEILLTVVSDTGRVLGEDAFNLVATRTDLGIDLSIDSAGIDSAGITLYDPDSKVTVILEITHGGLS